MNYAVLLPPLSIALVMGLAKTNHAFKVSILPEESQYFRLWGDLRRKSGGGGPSIATISARRCASE